MKHLSRVVWSEGMHLSAHHFQAQNKYFEDSVYFAASTLWFATYGLIECDLDDEAIQNGRVAIRHARGTLPDGLPFSMPEADPIVAALDIKPLISEIEHTVTIYLGAPAYRSDAANCAIPENGDTAGQSIPRRLTLGAKWCVVGDDADHVRYNAESFTLSDENTGRDEKEVSLGRKNLKLYAETNPPDGYIGMPIARVVRESSHFVYDANYVPPCLHIMGNKRLMRLVESLVSRLEEKSASLTIQGQGGQGTRGGFSRGEVSAFWFLHTVNSNLPTLRHLGKLGRVHPEELFSSLLRLAGALCTFANDSNAATLPLYDHDDLTGCFDALETHINTHLEIHQPTNCVAIPLKVYANYFHAGLVQDERCFGTSRWILSVRGGIGEADIISLVPRLVKVCSAMHIQKLADTALSGLALTHLPAPPPAISPRLEHQYFSITKDGRCWDYIVSTKQIGVYVPQQIPRAEVEILVVL